jgi:hypothetical protein
MEKYYAVCLSKLPPNAQSWPKPQQLPDKGPEVMFDSLGEWPRRYKNFDTKSFRESAARGCFTCATISEFIEKHGSDADSEPHEQSCCWGETHSHIFRRKSYRDRYFLFTPSSSLATPLKSMYLEPRMTLYLHTNLSNQARPASVGQQALCWATHLARRPSTGPRFGSRNAYDCTPSVEALWAMIPPAGS